MALDATVGGATANTYATLAEYQAYGALRGWTLSGADATDEINLLRAMDYLVREYDLIGYNATSIQALPYPRVTGIYINGYAVAPDIIPQQWKDAQCEMAFLLQGGADPFATVTTGAIKAERDKAGPVETETEYATFRETPRFVAIEGLIRPFIKGSGLQVRIERG